MPTSSPPRAPRSARRRGACTARRGRTTLLAHVLASVLAQVPAIDAKRIEDVIVGCAMPEFEQGMNVARIGVLLAGLPNSVAGMTINRFCSSGLNAVSIAADRIRTRRGGHHDRGGDREHEHDPDARSARDQRGGVRARREHRHRVRHGPHGREGRSAMEDLARGPGRVRAGVAPEGARRAGGGRIRRRGQPDHRARARAGPRDRQDRHDARRPSSATRVRARTRAPRASRSCVRFSRPRAR